MTIDANRVEEILKDCLYDESEVQTFKDNNMEGHAVPADAVPAEGIMARFLFNPAKLEANRAEITDMLLQLPEPFMKSKGGGWSFLQACVDKNGEQWTGLHQTMDRLFTLGIAIGRAKNLLPRAIWSAMPGGMPYFMVIDDADVVSTAAG